MSRPSVVQSRCQSGQHGQIDVEPHSEQTAHVQGQHPPLEPRCSELPLIHHLMVKRLETFTRHTTSGAMWVSSGRIWPSPTTRPGSMRAFSTG